ncbi:unnamed protein product [Ectocarpus sp. CCAP 1310/34]|nr:unnamed protein product [Ectocarpus sp. CCAP 1310/34]
MGLVIVDLVRVVDDGDGTKSRVGKWERFLSCRDAIAAAIPLTAIKIILVVWQIVTQFASVVDVEYPEIYERFLAALNLVNFNLGYFLSFLCLVETNFYGRLAFSTIVPLAILGGLAAKHAIAKRNNRHSQVGMREATDKHLSIALFIVFAIYSSVSFTIFQTFMCETLDDEVEYLRADYSLTCSTSTHTIMEVYAGLMVLVYPIGIPAVFAWWLASNRKDLVQDRSGGTTTPENLRPMKDLWEPYKPRRYFYELVECGRRIVLTGLAVFLFPGTAAQVAIEVAFAAGLLVVFEVLAPFVDPMDAWLYRSGALVVFFSMYLALLLKVDASDENSESQQVFAAVLVAAHVSMVLAVLLSSLLSAKKVGIEAMRKQVEVRDVPVARNTRSSWRASETLGAEEEPGESGDNWEPRLGLAALTEQPQEYQNEGNGASDGTMWSRRSLLL